MARIKGKDTKPELQVRRALHAAGLRFRLHANEVPGRPDIVFRRKKIAVFVHGCFWHRHPDPECKLTRTPKSRLEFWPTKFNANVARDLRNVQDLQILGWEVEIVWECELSAETITNLAKRIRDREAPSKINVRLK